MKVHESQGSHLKQVNKNTKKRIKEDDFQKIMDRINALPANAEKIPGKKIFEPVAGGIRLLHETGQVNGLTTQFEKGHLIEALQETLDIIDFYALKLADSSMPVAELDPLVNHLEDKLNTLRNMETAPGIPKKLKSVITDMTVAIGAEIAKFRRGDYL